MQNYISASRKLGISLLCHLCQARTPGLQWGSPRADVGLPGNPREATGLGERSRRGGEGSRQPQSPSSPPPSGCFQTHASTTCVRSLWGVLLRSPSSWGSAYRAGSAAGRVNLVICNGFSIPVNISSPESRDRDSAGRRALAKPVVLQFSSREGWGLTSFLPSSLQDDPHGEWGSGLGLLCFTSKRDGLPFADGNLLLSLCFLWG